MIAALVLGLGSATEEQRQQEHERRLRELEAKVLPPTPDPAREPRSSEHRDGQKKTRKSKATKKKRRGY